MADAKVEFFVDLEDINPIVEMYEQIVPYIAAWCAIQCDTMASKTLVLRSFQLVKPYLQELKRVNPGSVLGMTRLETFELESIYFIPAFMNNSLKFVGPVISLDAAHLRREFKRT